MPKTFWYLRRLRMMSLEEIFGMRLGRAVRDAVVPDIRRAPDNVDLKIRCYDRMLAADHAALFPGKAAEVVAEGERVLSATISLFGRDYRFGEPVDWKADPLSGWRWPDYGVSPYDGAADPKNVWELNRHQFLPILGEAYFLNGDERYADCAVSLILSWIEANPPYRGINWISGIELALRQLSWAWTLRFIANSPSLDHGARKRIAGSMYLQTRRISRNLSMHSSANNHLIAELAAMVVIGAMLGQERYVEKGARILAEEIDRQILPDGVGAEQSPSYQAYTMEYFALSVLALMEKGKEAHPAVIEGLRRGALFLDTIREEDGGFPMIGDSDSGVVLRLSPSYAEEKSLLNITAFLCGMEKMLRDDIAADDKSFWLLGREKFLGLATLVRRGDSRKLESRAFAQGGYYILLGRIGKKHVRIICNAAPLGMMPLSAHGHADALSIIVDVEGHPLFIDSGTYTYGGGNFWRDYFRGTSAHNTVRLGGRDQAEFKGSFMAFDLARAKCIEWKEGCRFVGRQYAYAGKEGLIHERTIEFGADNVSLVITDAFEGEGGSVAEVCFHVDPRCKVQKGLGNLIEMDTPAGMVALSLGEGLGVTLHYGDDGLPSGWKSPCYGSLEPTFTIVGKARVQGGTRLTTRLFF